MLKVRYVWSHDAVVLSSVRVPRPSGSAFTSLDHPPRLPRRTYSLRVNDRNATLQDCLSKKPMTPDAAIPKSREGLRAEIRLCELSA